MLNVMTKSFISISFLLLFSITVVNAQSTDLTVNYNISNESDKTIEIFNPIACGKAIGCQREDKKINLESGNKQTITHTFDLSGIDSEYAIVSCEIVFDSENSDEMECEQKEVELGEIVEFDISLGKETSKVFADLNGDCYVNALDMALVILPFGKKGYGIRGDINEDGAVNAEDISIIIDLLGKEVCGSI
jgi:hypothetical protein